MGSSRLRFGITAALGLLCAAGVGLGCSSNSQTQSSNSQTQIAIAGTWALSNVSIKTGKAPGTDGIVATFDGARYEMTYLPSGAVDTGTIEEFNNDAQFLVMRVTRDDLFPDTVGIYDKCSWQLPSADRMIQSYYKAYATFAEAKASNTVTWGPTPPWVRQ
jgi:hypothetical protein